MCCFHSLSSWEEPLSLVMGKKPSSRATHCLPLNNEMLRGNELYLVHTAFWKETYSILLECNSLRPRNKLPDLRELVTKKQRVNNQKEEMFHRFPLQNFVIFPWISSILFDQSWSTIRTRMGRSRYRWNKRKSIAVKLILEQKVRR